MNVVMGMAALLGGLQAGLAVDAEDAERPAAAADVSLVTVALRVALGIVNLLGADELVAAVALATVFGAS